ncbi:GGDEF domain-containing protein [Paenibacillus radicis (ex Xue et al. 2023)]|uniref:Diguanylate cyclase n=1 Tax=Paenibacillus radicis (ex Xue et al. 2023) TaxID=2972489 RepID=A0ABT1YHC7_9BACL|nr:diguanylate cyclase [Paenibacillus radicis (ex Xue et al. 2023)]MCR8631814.1 diguanylate cyclase [Paenibacillus radicis (ex Xue et al. 2023)]
MNLSGRMYANIFVQLLAVIFLTLYVYFTRHLYPVNYVWFILALSLGVFGYLRIINEALIACLVVVLLYGCYTLYLLYMGKTHYQIGWNDIVWLIIFPFYALVGGISRNDVRSKSNAMRTTGANHAEGEFDEQHPFDGTIELDTMMGFADSTRFMGKLQEEVFRGLRAKRPLTLMLIEVQYFQEFKNEYGHEQSQMLVHRIAELIRDVMRDVDCKGYLGDGLFGVILTGSEQMNISISIEWMDDKFNSLLLSRPRREGTVRARLRYGRSVCPQDGMNFQEIYDKAKLDLIISV